MGSCTLCNSPKVEWPSRTIECLCRRRSCKASQLAMRLDSQCQSVRAPREYLCIMERHRLAGCSHFVLSALIGTDHRAPLCRVHHPAEWQTNAPDSSREEKGSESCLAAVCQCLRHCCMFTFAFLPLPAIRQVFGLFAFLHFLDIDFLSVFSNTKNTSGSAKLSIEIFCCQRNELFASLRDKYWIRPLTDNNIYDWVKSSSRIDELEEPILKKLY